MEVRKGFICPAKAGEEMGVIGLEMKNGLPGYLELYCISGGPVFLLLGNVNGSDANSWLHKGGEARKRFEAIAVSNASGVTGCAILPGNPGPITIVSDVESVGLVRVSEICE